MKAKEKLKKREEKKNGLLVEQKDEKCLKCEMKFISRNGRKICTRCKNMNKKFS